MWGGDGQWDGQLDRVVILTGWLRQANFSHLLNIATLTNGHVIVDNTFFCVKVIIVLG